VWLRKHEKCGYFGGSSFDHGYYLYHFISMHFVHFFVAGAKAKTNKTLSMAESSNTESVYENMEKQSLEYGNG
jgi:hypothetical protein